MQKDIHYEYYPESHEPCSWRTSSQVQGGEMVHVCINATPFRNQLRRQEPVSRLRMEQDLHPAMGPSFSTTSANTICIEMPRLTNIIEAKA